MIQTTTLDTPVNGLTEEYSNGYKAEYGVGYKQGNKLIRTLLQYTMKAWMHLICMKYLGGRSRKWLCNIYRLLESSIKHKCGPDENTWESQDANRVVFCSSIWTRFKSKVGKFKLQLSSFGLFCTINKILSMIPWLLWLFGHVKPQNGL